jgi:hypothetical protein
MSGLPCIFYTSRGARNWLRSLGWREEGGLRQSRLFADSRGHKECICYEFMKRLAIACARRKQVRALLRARG